MTIRNAYKELSYTIDSIIPKTYPNQREPRGLNWTLFAFISLKRLVFLGLFWKQVSAEGSINNVILPAASLLPKLSLNIKNIWQHSQAIAREKLVL